MRIPVSQKIAGIRMLEGVKTGDKRWCSESEGHEIQIKEMQILVIINVKGMIAALSDLRARLEQITEEEDYKALNIQDTVH